MTTHQLPAELQVHHTRLRSLIKPETPEFHDTVKASEVALEDMSILGLGIFALLPWWAEGMADCGGDESGWRDYAIGFPLVLTGTAVGLAVNTDLEWWNVFSHSMLAATLFLLLMFVFHLIFHKCISMFIYNRLFRRAWMKKMRAADAQNYQDAFDSYPQRLQDYNNTKAQALADAQTALNVYHASNPSQRYLLDERGYEAVSVLGKAIMATGTKVRGIFGKLMNK